MIPIDCWLGGRGYPSGAYAFSSNYLGVLGVPAVNLIFRERIRERLLICFLNHPLVVAAEEFLQAIGVHDVLTRHVRDGVRRNG